jgi:hypothetical protein
MVSAQAVESVPRTSSAAIGGSFPGCHGSKAWRGALHRRSTGTSPPLARMCYGCGNKERPSDANRVPDSALAAQWHAGRNARRLGGAIEPC